MTDRPMTIPDMIAGRSGPVLGATDRPDMSYADLAALIDRAGARLASLGIGPGDAVAIALPNGPEMASSFLAVASHATAAPLNPSYKEDEFAFYMEDLGAKALIVQAGNDSPARAAAARLGTTLIELVPGDTAGAFDLTTDGASLATGEAKRNGPGDTALVLHTSGTTSRPKIVPLSATNICTSAANIAGTLNLTETDRCLNIMPLFHIHGLIAAVLSSVSAGAAITCTPGFDALKFFGWMEAAKPTWYTAVPTMHQAILSRAARNAAVVEGANLRFIRSSSASLPVPVLHDLEKTFGCRVIEAYGMTEAAHQMASNQLEPGQRKPGTVGAAAGPEVAIMGEDGSLLSQGEVGEIVIRGPNVTAGYQNNPKANAENFTNGWFRTGDQGSLDEDGFLTIRGRLKEIINRGGEKVSPGEVDAVLMEHPAIAQCVTFAMPHAKLGEEVAAAVVLKEGAEADEAGIREHCSKTLAAFKVPRKVLILDEIPKGSTGKLQRIGLAEKLGLSA
ncbi:acyl--CoA ligase [Oceaniglobus roseus]|uniref:acyl--CoA ligase n=1 Tax=Oceaniglobus roseus TaxID=1737570 RepID=UPI000C7EF77F|nr:acyl--CoA ligase [Kandeliimicrobium roseum]